MISRDDNEPLRPGWPHVLATLGLAGKDVTDYLNVGSRFSLWLARQRRGRDYHLLPFCLAGSPPFRPANSAGAGPPVAAAAAGQRFSAGMGTRPRSDAGAGIGAAPGSAGRERGPEAAPAERGQPSCRRT